MIRLTRDQAKARILQELDTLDNPIEAKCLDVEGSGKNWKTVYRPESARIDEVQFAALYEARQRMAAAGLVLC